MRSGNLQKLYGLAVGAGTALIALLAVGIIIDATDRPEIGPPRSNISAG